MTLANPLDNAEGDDRMTENETPANGFPVVKILVGLTLAAVFFFVARNAGDKLPQFAEWVDGLGVWGPIVYILGYAALTVSFVPGSLLTLAAGAVFGLGKGTVFAWTGATLGATLAFLIARYLARSAIERKVAANPKFAAIDNAVAGEGRKIVFLLRLSPIFPFSLLNYGLGLTKVRLVDYVIASLGMIPGTLLYVYSGKIAGDVVNLASESGPDRGAGYYSVLGLGLLATLIVTTLVTRTARKALASVEQEAPADAA
ncbi:MAG: TVP38/TMEM64 family protein [Acidobacteriota bacterium]